jgi:ribonucleoside-triphosphate reductase
MEKINNQVATKVTLLRGSDKVCPVCGSKRIQGISRVTGYMSLDERFGSGKVAERKRRIDHNAGHEHNYHTK